MRDYTHAHNQKKEMKLMIALAMQPTHALLSG